MGVPIGTENDIQTSIQDLVELFGLPRPMRSDAGTVRVEEAGTGKVRWIRKMPQGWPDLTGIVPPGGRMLAIEVKRPGGKVRPGQRETLASIRDAGGVALLADDLRVVERALVALRADPAARLDESGNPEEV